MTTPPPIRIRCGNWVNRLEKPGADFERSTKAVVSLLNEAEELTKANTKLTLVVAFNYGSRQEIANAAQRLAREVAEGKREPSSIDADSLGQYLDAPDKIGRAHV